MRLGRVVALMVAVHLGAGTAGAGPRDAFAPDPSMDEPDEIIEPTEWSRRLLGKFTVEGSIYHDECVEPDSGGMCGSINEWLDTIEGKADCIAFAEGPGLQCVINLVWPEHWRDNNRGQLGGVSDLTPAMVLAGFVTSTTGGIRVLLVNDRGLAHPGAMVLKGSTASARPPCVNQPGLLVCEQKFTVKARPGAKVSHVTLSARTAFIRSKLDRKPNLDAGERSIERGEEWIEVSLSLRRDPADSTGPEVVAPPVAK